MLIQHSVGTGGANKPHDTRLVQHLLNDARGQTAQALLSVDGIAGPRTVDAIRNYQRSTGLVADGRIDPAGPTLQRLVQGFTETLMRGMIHPTDRGIAPASPADDTLRTAVAECLQRLRG